MPGNGRKKKNITLLVGGGDYPSSRRMKKPKYEVYWENPPGPSSGLYINRYQGQGRYERHVRPGDLLNPTEIAAILQFSRMHVYRLMRSGELKTVKRGGRRLVALKSVMDFMRKRGLLPEPTPGKIFLD